MAWSKRTNSGPKMDQRATPTKMNPVARTQKFQHTTKKFTLIKYSLMLASFMIFKVGFGTNNCVQGFSLLISPIVPIFFEKCTDFRNPIKASSQHDVGNLMPVTSVYSVTPDSVAQHHDYTHSMHAASPIVTTMVSAVPIEHTETPQHTVVQFEAEGAYAPQVSFR